ncbi:prostate and testis expressed protein 4-like [Varanus komodoensis]|uniref:prostate and testis expressed protein 4-like n=1 Tax=Varanus komodoensis TaxID=61221 RepID=UPI001CF7837B|nr:prostate and testis expressed protein 4-like [Varanus komodoensis]
MNKYFLLGFSALLFCTAVQGLVCRVCHYKVGSLCFRSGEPCRAGAGQYCETTKVYSGELPLYKTHGCGKFAELCNKMERRDSAFRMAYERTCCNTNLCNV